MYKWLILSCLCICLLCQGSAEKLFAQPESDVVSQKDNEPSVSLNRLTEAATGFSWDVSQMDAPHVDEITLQCEDSEAQAGIVMSPWFVKDVAALKPKLEQVHLLKGLCSGYQEKEIGHVVETPQGQMTGYELIQSWQYATTNEKLINEEPEVVIEYHQDTTVATGYTNIVVRFNVPPETLTSNMQQDIHQLLCVVYGDEYAAFLCYAPNQEGSLLCTEKQEYAKVHFRRNRTKSSLIFSVKLESRVNPLTLPREHVHLFNVSDDIFEFVSHDIGEVDLNDYRNTGARMFQTYFNDYDGTVSDYASSYTMTTLRLEDGWHAKEFSLNAMTAQTNVPLLLSPDFVIAYKIIYEKDDVIDVNFGLKCSAGQTDIAEKDVSAARFADTALKMVQCITNIDVPALQHEAYQYPVSVLGAERQATISLQAGCTMADKFVSYIEYNIT